MNLKSQKIRYGLKKFALYLMFALPACNIPFPFLGLVFGSPAAVFASIFLAIYDGIEVDENRPPDVFTSNMWLLWACEIVIGIVFVIIFYAVMK